jgi:hypothetical protein
MSTRDFNLSGDIFRWSIAASVWESAGLRPDLACLASRTISATQKGMAAPIELTGHLSRLSRAFGGCRP